MIVYLLRVLVFWCGGKLLNFGGKIVLTPFIFGGGGGGGGGGGYAFNIWNSWTVILCKL